MQNPTPPAAPARHRRASVKTCPQCQGPLVRKHRRVLDRLYSLVRPLKRYRCGNFNCQWEGNIPRAHVQAPADTHGADTSMALTRPPRRSHVPGSFNVHMALVVLGVVFVVVIGVIQPDMRIRSGDPGPVSTVQEPAGGLPTTNSESR